jgi:arabinogalactan endo-1,4-beta-galactosidase
MHYFRNKSYTYNLIYIFVFATSVASCKKKIKTDDAVITTENKLLVVRAFDLSFLPEIRQSGIITKNEIGQAEDMLTTLKKNGVNTIRLRLWHTPQNIHSSFEEVKNFSQEIKNNGMKVWLTVHYSDNWADPGKQTKPTAWNNLALAQLKDSVYNYTQKIITEMQPDFIQIGNEINSGLLWPEGNISNTSQMLDLLKQGIKAVRDNSTTTKILLHYAGHKDASTFFENFKTTDYDIIALSYYAWWHGKDLNALESNLNTLGQTYNKPILIAETAYPFTYAWNDWTNNQIGDSSQILPEFKATSEGQKAYLNKMKSLITNSNRGIGLCYWGGEWIAFKGPTASNGSSWENLALWDFYNKALPALSIYQD